VKVGKTINKIRKTLFLSVKQFSDIIEVTPQTIRNYESGKRIPRLEIAKKIMEFAKKNKMDVEASDFFYL
jgi:DNA-binding transcriptional regulator YiaG